MEFHAVDLVLREELLKKYGHKLEETTRTWNSAAILQNGQVNIFVLVPCRGWLLGSS